MPFSQLPEEDCQGVKFANPNPMCYVAEPLSDKIFLTRKFPDLQNLCSVKKIEAFS